MRRGSQCRRCISSWVTGTVGTAFIQTSEARLPTICQIAPSPVSGLMPMTTERMNAA